MVGGPFCTGGVGGALSVDDACPSPLAVGGVGTASTPSVGLVSPDDLPSLAPFLPVSAVI